MTGRYLARVINGGEVVDICLNTRFNLDRSKIDVDFLFELTETIEKGFYGSNTSNV